MNEEPKAFPFNTVFAVCRGCTRSFDTDDEFLEKTEELLRHVFNKEISYHSDPQEFAIALRIASDYIMQKHPELEDDFNIPTCITRERPTEGVKNCVEWKKSNPELFEKMIEIKPLPQNSEEILPESIPEILDGIMIISIGIRPIDEEAG